MQNSGFMLTLHSDTPAADRAKQLELYGWLIGDWTMTAVMHEGAAHNGRGEIHFGWVLEGRAIQDVWNLYDIFYGTTLRVYDPSLDAWHIFWSDPVRQYYARQLGRKQGNDIVQVGKAGELTARWTFTDIAPDSFRWLGERSADDGKTWMLDSDYRATRVKSPKA
ncbi:MAG TPA: hypothetical protein VHD59_03315 [Pseudolabrys sp.]|nr:hypothetical protein [Pseudolabrys sp.]